jgi:hypothetical protein
MFSIQGIVSIIVQFVIFPPAAHYFGILNLLRSILVAQPLFYLVIPYTPLLTPTLAQITFIILWTLRSASVVMAFPCSIILVTNSTASLRVLGTVNGLATATNAIGRAFGPTVAGGLFTWGVLNNGILAPFVFLAVLGCSNLLPLFWVVEGDGFGGRDETVVEEDEERRFMDYDQNNVTLEQYSPHDKQ